MRRFISLGLIGFMVLGIVGPVFAAETSTISRRILNCAEMKSVCGKYSTLTNWGNIFVGDRGYVELKVVVTGIPDGTDYLKIKVLDRPTGKGEQVEHIKTIDFPGTETEYTFTDIHLLGIATATAEAYSKPVMRREPNKFLAPPRNPGVHGGTLIGTTKPIVEIMLVRHECIVLDQWQ